MQEPQDRCYFAIFGLPKPQPEHRQIADVIREVSGGDFKLFPVPGGMAAVFTARVKPWRISFARILLNGDTLFITEIQPGSFTHVGYGAAGGWINSHMPQK